MSIVQEMKETTWHGILKSQSENCFWLEHVFVIVISLLQSISIYILTNRCLCVISDKVQTKKIDMIMWKLVPQN